MVALKEGSLLVSQMAQKRAHLIVRGQVQGVGYRFFATQVANEIGVNGRVKNNALGFVEAVVEGDEEKVEKFINALRRGHPWARVDSVEVNWQGFSAEFKNFEIAY